LDSHLGHLPVIARRWIASVVDAAKANVDGGISRLGDRVVAAALIRDKDGHYLGSWEAHACCEVVALAQDLNIWHLVVA
jgi:hypothetical protein